MPFHYEPRIVSTILPRPRQSSAATMIRCAVMPASRAVSVEELALGDLGADSSRPTALIAAGAVA